MVKPSLGASLNIGYFAQAHEGLHPDWTLMEEIDAIAPHLLPAEVRNYLAKFLFTEDDVFKQVSVLSGGERGRLAPGLPCPAGCQPAPAGRTHQPPGPGRPGSPPIDHGRLQRHDPARLA